MAQVELIMPKMGESIMEATILKWVKKAGDMVALDETILEIATDKVDTEIPSPVAGKISKILFQEDEVVEIGKVIALIETDVNASIAESPSIATPESPAAVAQKEPSQAAQAAPVAAPATSTVTTAELLPSNGGSKFYSPLVRNIAKDQNITSTELGAIEGSGLGGRVTKKDVLEYVATRHEPATIAKAPETSQQSAPAQQAVRTTTSSMSGDVEIIEMDRMRRLIAEHMVKSKHTSPHVTSFVEVDVTGMVEWRNRVKSAFEKKYQQKITFTPIFIEAIAKAIADFPMINISVEGNQIIRKKNINIGMAAALPTGNLIVPVIKNANNLNLLGLTTAVNDLASRARDNKLKPEEIQDGTFTLTNVGTFGNVMGTPIINQPQVAIMAAGAIRKKPAVLETEFGDVIAIRQMMFLSLSYDHRVVDGSLGGSFLKRVSDYLERFDHNQGI